MNPRRTGRFLAVAAASMMLAACDPLLGGEKSPPDRVLWTAPEGATRFFGTPGADGERVYVETLTGVKAFSRESGAVLWTSPLEEWGASRALLRAGGALYGASAGPVYALDAATGAVRWQRDDLRAADAAYAAPALDDRALYVGTRTLQVLALDPATGQARWSTRLAADWQPNSLVRGISVSGDTVYVGADRCLNPNCHQMAAVIVALDRGDGRELWRWQSAGTKGGIMRAPVVAGRLLLATDGYENTFFAVDRFTGQEAWRTRGQAGYVGGYAPPVVDEDGVLYVGLGDTRVYAAEAATGRVLWSTPTRASVIDVVACGRLVLAHNDGLEVLDRRTGRHLGLALGGKDDEFTVSGIAVSGSRAFIAGNRKLYAVDCR